MCGRPGFLARRRLLVCVEGASIAYDAVLELGELAVGGALRAAGHLPAGGELCEGLAHPQRFGGVAAAFADGGEPFVGMASDEPFGDARLEEVDGPFGVAPLAGRTLPPRCVVSRLRRSGGGLLRSRSSPVLRLRARRGATSRPRPGRSLRTCSSDA